MGFKIIIQPSMQTLIICTVAFLLNFRFVHNAASLAPTNISSIWKQTQTSSHVTTDVLQNPSFIASPNSNRVRKSLEKNPKVNYRSAGAGGSQQSQDEEDYYYEEDTSNFKVSKTIESPPPAPPPSNKMNDHRPPSPKEGDLGTGNLQSKPKDTRNIEIDIAFPRPRQQQYDVPPPVRIPTRQQDDDEDYDDTKLQKTSAVVSPEDGQLSPKSIKSVADAVAESILNDVDRLYESLENGDPYRFTEDTACSEDSSYFLC